MKCFEEYFQQQWKCGTSDGGCGYTLISSISRYFHENAVLWMWVVFWMLMFVKTWVSLWAWAWVAGWAWVCELTFPLSRPSPRRVNDEVKQLPQYIGGLSKHLVSFTLQSSHRYKDRHDRSGKLRKFVWLQLISYSLHENFLRISSKI